MTDSLQWLSIL